MADEKELRDDLPEVILIPADVDMGALGDFMFGDGPMPMGARGETFAEFTARGRVDDCDCQLIQCVCAQARLHKKGCVMRTAMTCAIPIPCDEHGLDDCPKCYPCTCDGV